MAIIIRDVTSMLFMADACNVSNGSTLPIYGSVDKADNYFALILGGEKWSHYSREKKLKGLISASQRIDRLNFIGVKTSSDQALQFPRGTDTLVPVAIETATYELALVLLRGVNPDTERDNLSAISQGYGQLRSQHDRSIVQGYIAAGIPSATAWEMLYPFLQPTLTLDMRRIS